MEVVIKSLCFLVVLLNLQQQVDSKSIFYENLTNLCIRFKMDYEHTEHVNATTEYNAFIYGPGGIERIVLPQDLESADQLARLKILNPKAETVVIMHGFHDNGHSGFSLGITEGYLNLGKYNVIALNGEKKTTAPGEEYARIARIYELLGDITGNFLTRLHLRKAIKASKIHLIGISIGAQMVARAARLFRNMTGLPVGRITGLDPSGPCFEYKDVNLSKDDALYVDIIHVNAGFGGTIEARGTIGFVVNGGGPGQPGCKMPLEIGCNHQRACTLYIDSLNPNYEPFYAVKCDSYLSFAMGLCNNNKDLAIMGYPIDRSKKGLYYLRTKAASPFSLGMKGTKSDGLLRTMIAYGL